jgi:hypothetical protein
LNHQKKKSLHFLQISFLGLFVLRAENSQKGQKIFIDDLAFLQDGCADFFSFKQFTSWQQYKLSRPMAGDSSIIHSFESVAARLLDIPSSAWTHVYIPEL